ncbi:MAG: sigma-70 family RNA polymerase sigma factor [Candidatus Poribacteria bacterium]
MRTEDGSIIRECINGDSASWGLLVDKYKASIFALAYSRLRNFQDAEDVTQEVFLKAYTSLRTIRHWDNFVVWLRSVTINLCKNKIREQTRRRDIVPIKQDMEALENASLDSYQEEQFLSWRNEALDSLDKALDSLPEQYRQILTLHYLGGMKGEEISKFLSISHGTVRQRLSRARAMLKEEVLVMISTDYEQRKLSASFTFRIVEAVKKIRINPPSMIKGLPWGLSVGAGFLMILLSLGSHIQINLPDIAMGLPLPNDMKILKVGEIPVDVVKVSTISSIGNKGDGKGFAPDPKGQENAFLMAPQGEGEWTKIANMPTQRYGSASCVVNGKIYVISGIRSQWGVITSVEEYDPVKNIWIKKSNIPTPRFFMPASVVNGKIYVIGGLSFNGVWTVHSDVEEYDPVLDKWTKKANMTSPRACFATVTVNDKIYAIGGVGADLGLGIAIVEEYDPIADKWIRKADMPTSRSALCASAIGDKIYAIGGQIGQFGPFAGECVSTVEEYDIITDKWTKKSNMQFTRALHTTAFLNGYIYAIGGSSQDNRNIGIPSVEKYESVTDTWVRLDDMPSSRFGCVTNEVNGKLYVMGGTDNANNIIGLVTVEQFALLGKNFIDSQDKMLYKWGKIKI